MKTDSDKINVKDLLPQKDPFVFIDNLVGIDGATTVTRFEVRKDNIFFDNGVLSAAALVENMAQTCAVRMGYVNAYERQTEPQVGYIGAVKDLQIARLPREGETLTTTVEFEEEVFGVILAKACVKAGPELLAEGKMKIAIGR